MMKFIFICHELFNEIEIENIHTFSGDYFLKTVNMHTVRWITLKKEVQPEEIFLNKEYIFIKFVLMRDKTCSVHFYHKIVVLGPRI